MKTDICQKIESDFGIQSKLALDIVLEIDALTKGYITDEAIRAMIFIASGDLDVLLHFLTNRVFRIEDILNSNPEIFGTNDFKQTFHQLGLL